MTDMAQGHTVGALQADRRITPEPTFAVQITMDYDATIERKGVSVNNQYLFERTLK